MSLLDRLHLPAPAGGAASLSDATFHELRAFIYERTGLYFRDNKRYLLENRLGRRLAALGLPDFEAYLALLRGAGARAEADALFNAVTINETYFFRHADQHALFVGHLLPELIEERLRRGQRRVRLWSAACSTGDEPYTLALLIRETLRTRYPHVAFEILGTDLNTDVLAHARRGFFSSYAVRNVPPALLRQYFQAHGDGPNRTYELDRRVRSMVTFQTLNLVDPAGMARMRDVDAAFCANVLIYFDDEAKRQVAGHLYHALRDGGYLFVGVSETLYGVTQSFQPTRFAQAVAYRKPPSTTTSALQTPQGSPSPALRHV